MITVEEAKKYRLSKNFTLWEFLESEKSEELGYMDMQMNIPEKYILNLKRLCENVLQPIRDKVGAMTITSGYRCPALNAAINGSKTSDHMQGKAADWRCSNMGKAWRIALGLEFKQLIKYGNFWFIHTSYDEFEKRKQVLFK
jgi:uncharacterized protein YcbK (DUF882 family)